MGVNPVEQVFEWGVTRPGAPAIVSADVTVTFAQLADATRRTASRLRQLGLRRGDVVGLRARPEWEAVLALAVMHEGAVSLHASDAVLRGYAPLLDWQFGETPLGSPRARTVVPVGESFIESLGAVNPRIDSADLDGDDLCRIVFSSGTTGTPKGVAFTVDVLRARTDSARSNWMPSDPFFCLLGIDTVSGFQTFAWSVLHGEPWIVPADGAGSLALLARTGARSLKSSPAQLAELLAAFEAAERVGARPALALETVQVAGALVSATLARRCVAVLGVDPVYLYGSTEAGTITRGLINPQRPEVVGAVVDEAEVRVLDESGRGELERGQAGIVEYRTPSTAKAYWHGGDADAAFHDGWFRPGDRGTLLSDGALEISGRIDDVVNAGGAKINLALLDVQLAELEGVLDAASFSILGDSGMSSVAVVYVSESDVQPEELARAVRAMLPSIPITTLVRVSVIPRNARGKVSRESLSALVGES